MTRFEIAGVFGRSVWLPFADGLRVNAAKRGDSSSRVAYARLPDWPEMVIWQRFLRPNDRFVDVGANVGLYSLLACSCGAAVVAVEPAADMAAQLERNVLRNGFEVDVRRVALMDRPGTVMLAGVDPNRRRVSQQEGVGQTGTQVLATTLDEMLDGRSVRGIKIDVEGNERLVLAGANRTLMDPALELVQLEWNDTSRAALGEGREPLAQVLESYGFELFQSDEVGHFSKSPAGSCHPFGRDVFAVRGAAVRLFGEVIERASEEVVGS